MNDINAVKVYFKNYVTSILKNEPYIEITEGLDLPDLKGKNNNEKWELIKQSIIKNPENLLYYLSANASLDITLRKEIIKYFVSEELAGFILILVTFNNIDLAFLNKLPDVLQRNLNLDEVIALSKKVKEDTKYKDNGFDLPLEECKRRVLKMRSDLALCIHYQSFFMEYQKRNHDEDYFTSKFRESVNALSCNFKQEFLSQTVFSSLPLTMDFITYIADNYLAMTRFVNARDDNKNSEAPSKNSGYYLALSVIVSHFTLEDWNRFYYRACQNENLSELLDYPAMMYLDLKSQKEVYKYFCQELINDLPKDLSSYTIENIRTFFRGYYLNELIKNTIAKNKFAEFKSHAFWDLVKKRNKIAEGIYGTVEDELKFLAYNAIQDKSFDKFLKSTNENLTKKVIPVILNELIRFTKKTKDLYLFYTDTEIFFNRNQLKEIFINLKDLLILNDAYLGVWSYIRKHYTQEDIEEIFYDLIHKGLYKEALLLARESKIKKDDVIKTCENLLGNDNMKLVKIKN